MKSTLTLLCILLTLNVFGQNTLTAEVCERSYSAENPISDTSSILFGQGDMFIEASCSWRCTQTIRIGQDNNSELLDSISDFSTNTSVNIEFSIKKKLRFQIYLSDHIIFEDTLKAADTEPVLLRGMLISNGSRNSKNDYLNFSRIKKLNVYIDKKLVGVVTLKDTPKFQYVDFLKSIPLSDKIKIDLMIEIEDIYRGRKTDTLAISELHFDGDGGHSITEKFCMKK